MALAYLTREGDVLDRVAWGHYGAETSGAAFAGYVERVYEANRGLADYGPVLPGGLTIILPDPPEAVPVKTLRIWG